MTDLPTDPVEGRSTSRTPRRILIVEDNAADARLIHEMLSRAEAVRSLGGSFDLLEAQRLADGLALLEGQDIDLVLLDLSLPDTQGVETFSKVRQRASEVPIIVLTGADDEELAIRAVQGGAQDFLVKGKIDSELLWQAVHYAIERHGVQAQQRKLDARIREAQRGESLAMMAGGIAHDYNNLLTIILGNIEAVLEGNPNQAFTRSSLLDAHRATLRAAELTEHVLAYSGGLRVARRPLQLAPLLTKLLERKRDEIPKAVRLRVDLSPELPYVAADPDLLEQVFASLFDNAVEALAGKEGELSVRTAVAGEDVGAEDAFVSVEISDTGPGMDEATRARCFDPFFTTKFTGRGLGLASAFGIVRAHRGSIQVQSEPEKGSTFRVLLPQQTRPLTLMERPAPGPIPLRPPARTARAKPARLPRVLLAEDDKDLLRLTKWILENSGYSAFTASDGLEAVELFEKHADEISVVLLDVTMPRMDGRDAMREILSRRPDARVVLCSGYSREDVSQGLEDFPHFRFLRKPFTRTQLTQLLQDVLSAPTN